MSNEEFEKRVVKLHRHLEGISLLYIDTSSNIIWKDRCRLEKMTIDFWDSLPEGEGGASISILQYMNLNHIDALIIHPEFRQPWLQELEEVFLHGKPVIVGQGSRVNAEAPAAYKRFGELGIPIVRRGENYYEKVLDVLDAQFAAKKK